MAKKQKKHSKRGGNSVITQNSPLYAFSRAMNVKTTGEVRDIIKTSKNDAASYAQAFRVERLTMAGTALFLDIDMILDTIKRIHEGSEIQYVWMVTRGVMGAALSQRRVVNDITPEALSYIQSNAEIFQNDVRFVPETGNLMFPEIVFFPDGTGFCFAPTNLAVKPMIRLVNSQNNKGHQITETDVGSKAIVVTGFDQNGNNGITFMFLPYRNTCLSDIAEENLSIIRIRNPQNGTAPNIKDNPLHEADEGPMFTEEEKRLVSIYVRTIVYLAHINRLNKSSIKMMGFEPTEAGSPCIRHLKIPGMQKDWSMIPFSNGFNVPKYGVHPYYGFLSARDMRDCLKALPEANANGDLSLYDKDGERAIEDGSSAEELGVLKKWIDHGTVYSVTDGVISSCLSKYSERDVGWVSLLSEIPTREFLLSFDDRQTFAIVAVRKAHVYVSCMVRGLEARHIPFASLAVSVPSSYKEPFRSILCILIHISGYYKKRREVLEERKQRVDVSRRAGGMSAHIGSKPADTKNASEGYDIDFDQLRLFNVTERAVKAVSSKVRVSRYGWHMPTHVRQAHKHRFWVGSGSKRHLEERWVEATIINKDGEPKACVHKVKTQNET